MLIASICISTSLASSRRSIITKPTQTTTTVQRLPVVESRKMQEFKKTPTTPVQKKSIFGTIYIRLKDGRLIAVH
jgi:hypothetical protein